MGKIDRKQFISKIVSTQIGENRPIKNEDIVYNKYANKTLPKSYKTTAWLSQYSGEWTEVQIRHLLRRTMFGVKDVDLQTLLGMNMSNSVDLLLNNNPPLPDPPVNNYSPDGTLDITGVAAGQTWVNAPVGDGTLNDYRRYSYKAWWIGQMLNQNLSIMEKMVFFWHNHFATQTYVVGDARLSYNHNLLLRANALGNFKTFVKQVTKDPAMLMYLNGSQNTKNSPDENYGRELQELFTVSKYNATNYTEDDVKAASKVLTGWRVNNTTLQSFFTPSIHDVSNKQFSAFYNNTLINGQSGANGANETDSLIDMIFTKAETAHYICTKMYRFFVYYNIDADIDANVITPLARLLINSNFEIKPVLQCLFKSDHFYSAISMGCYIKTPLDLLIGTFRTFNISIPTGLSAHSLYSIWNFVAVYGVKMGLDLGDPPNVAGWMPFYESPAYYEIWINSNTYPVRLEFTDLICGTGYSPVTGITIAIDIVGFTQLYPNAQDPDMLVDYFTTLLLGINISATEHDNLKGILLSGQTTNSYWTVAWTNYLFNPDAENTAIISSRLNSLINTLLRLPEYQLC